MSAPIPQTGTPGRRSRRSGTALAVAGLAAAAVLAPVGSAAAASATPAAAPVAASAATSVAAAGATRDIGPGANAGTRLTAAIQALRAGDTLRLAPGTYAVGTLRPNLVNSKGTASAPVRVTSADPSHPALIVGKAVFDSADYWQVSNIRFQGNQTRGDTLTMDSGTKWVLNHIEVFGGSSTQAYANLVVNNIGTRPPPTRWMIVNSYLHDAGTSTAYRGQLHQVYVTAGGLAGGLIARNLFVNTPMGAAVKLGNGGEHDALGPSGVTVANNTMVNGGRQVLLTGRVGSDTIRGNLMVKSTQTLTNGTDTVGVYLNDLTHPAGTAAVDVQDNYGSFMTRLTFDNGSDYGTWRNGGGNALAGDPQLHGAGVNGFHPYLAAAQRYGRYATTTYYTLPS